jgi:hypothetical protein
MHINLNIVINCLVKNEAILLSSVLPIWKHYPVNKFVFYDDGSTDETAEVIDRVLDSRAVIIRGEIGARFNEAEFRGQMLRRSASIADLVLSLDADEVLSANFFDHISEMFRLSANYQCRVRWYNLVSSVNYFRTDHAYRTNFVQALARPSAVAFNANAMRYHECTRLPQPHNPIKLLDGLGVIHLQALNLRFYVLKQLWYKHFEFSVYGKSVDEINSLYDPVVNNLKFSPRVVPRNVLGDFTFDPTVFDKVEQVKGYLSYIKRNFNSALVTFGSEFL